MLKQEQMSAVLLRFISNVFVESNKTSFQYPFIILSLLNYLYQINLFIFEFINQKAKAFQHLMNLKGKVVKASGKQYTLKEQLSEGGFSLIYATKNPDVICKVQVLDIPEVAKAFQKEKNFMKSINYSNIVKLYDWNQIKDKDGNHGFLFMENCSEGQQVFYLSTVFNILEKFEGSLPEKTILQIFYAVSSAIQQIHRNGIAHRDIKLQNVLVNKKGQYKICDFGSCSNQTIRMINNNNRADIEEYIQKTTTPLYRCPQQLDLYSGFQIGPKVDIFAMGVLVFMLCFKKQPFESRLSAINKQYFVPQQNPYSQQLMNILEQCFTCDPDLRPTASQVKSKVKNLQKRKKALVQINIAKQFQISYGQLVKAKNSKFSSLKEGNQNQNGNDEGFINKIIKIYNQFTTQTQGWIVSFIEDTEDAPMLKYSRSIISKCWEKRYKIDKVYEILQKYWESSKSRCLVVLKILIFLHNFLRKGPSEALNYQKQNNPIRLVTKIYNHWKVSQKHIAKQDPKRNIQVYGIIKYYCLVIIEKSKFAYQNSHLFEGNYSIIPYFSQKDQNIILKLPILQSMASFLQKCVLLHEILQKDEQNCPAKQIQRSILWSIADQQYCLISSFAFLLCAFKDALNYVKEDLNMNKIRDKICQVQGSFKISFKKLIILMQKTKTKTKQFFTTMENQGLTFNQNVLKQIERIQFNNQKLNNFKITKHLNYENNIGGLKIPFTYEEVVKNPTILASAAKKQSQIINAIDIDQFKIYQNPKTLNKQLLNQIKNEIKSEQFIKSKVQQKKMTEFLQFQNFSKEKQKIKAQKHQQIFKQSQNLMQFSHQNLNSDFFNPSIKTKKQAAQILNSQFFSVPSSNKNSNSMKKDLQFQSFLNFAVNSKQKQEDNSKFQRQSIKKKLIKDYDLSRDIYERLNLIKKPDFDKQTQKKSQQFHKIQIISFSDQQQSGNRNKDQYQQKQNINDFIKEKLQQKLVQLNVETKAYQESKTKLQDTQQKQYNLRKKTRRQKKAQRMTLKKQKMHEIITHSSEENK